jgi:hypothetical protein
MPSYLVARVEDHDSGIVYADGPKDVKQFVKGFMYEEAEDPSAAVEASFDGHTGRYVVVEVEARSLKTVVVE